MGMWDWLTSTKRPASGTPVCSRDELQTRLLALNRSTAPYQLIDGTGEGVDLIAAWKIVDAAWYEIFAKAGLQKVFKIRLKLDEASHQVRAKDEESTVSWSAGVPQLQVSRSKSWGQTQSVQFGSGYAFTEELRPGEVYRYRFATSELKGPIQQVVTECGWTYKGVAFGRL